MTSEDGRVWIRRVDAHRHVNSFGQLLLTTLLLAFERKDGSSTRRRHERASLIVRRGTRFSSLRLVKATLPQCFISASSCRSDANKSLGVRMPVAQRAA